MRRIIIVQPAIPKYRVPFFQILSNKYEVKLYSHKFDFLGVQSVKSKLNVCWGGGFASFKKRVYWSRHLPMIRGINKNDIVVVNGNPRIINYMFLLLICRLRRVKTIWWGHGWSAGSRGFWASFRIKMMGIANAVLVYTEYEREMLQQRNCFALNNGLDSDAILKAIKDSSVNHHFAHNTRLVFVGRITHKSNLNMVITALQDLPDNVSLSVIGDGDLKNELITLAVKLNVADRITWHGAMFDENDIAPIMLNSDIFVYPGSVGLSLIHAYNYGLPAIIHNNRSMHMPEFAAFKEGYNGFSYSENDVESLRFAINQYVELTTREKNQLRCNAFETIKDTYNIKDMVDRFEDAIDYVSK